MIQGDRLVQIFHRDSKYHVKLPAPPTLVNALNHLRQLEPHVRENLVVVFLVAETVVSADEALETDRAGRDERATEPAPPLPARSDSDPYMRAVVEAK